MSFSKKKFYITLNREQKRNALTFEMLKEICDTIEGLIVEPEIRVVIIRGKGTVFSSGVDFNSLCSLVGRFMTDTAAGGAPIRADISKLPLPQPFGGYRNSHHLRHARRGVRHGRGTGAGL